MCTHDVLFVHSFTVVCKIHIHNIMYGLHRTHNVLKGYYNII